MFLIQRKSEARCSYKIVLIKKILKKRLLRKTQTHRQTHCRRRRCRRRRKYLFSLLLVWLLRSFFLFCCFYFCFSNALICLILPNTTQFTRRCPTNRRVFHFTLVITMIHHTCQSRQPRPMLVDDQPSIMQYGQGRSTCSGERAAEQPEEVGGRGLV